MIDMSQWILMLASSSSSSLSLPIQGSSSSSSSSQKEEIPSVFYAATSNGRVAADPSRQLLPQQSHTHTQRAKAALGPSGRPESGDDERTNDASARPKLWEEVCLCAWMTLKARSQKDQDGRLYAVGGGERTRIHTVINFPFLYSTDARLQEPIICTHVTHVRTRLVTFKNC